MLVLALVLVGVAELASVVVLLAVFRVFLRLVHSPLLLVLLSDMELLDEEELLLVLLLLRFLLITGSL